MRHSRQSSAGGGAGTQVSAACADVEATIQTQAGGRLACRRACSTAAISAGTEQHSLSAQTSRLTREGWAAISWLAAASSPSAMALPSAVRLSASSMTSSVGATVIGAARCACKPCLGMRRVLSPQPVLAGPRTGVSSAPAAAPDRYKAFSRPADHQTTSTCALAPSLPPGLRFVHSSDC